MPPFITLALKPSSATVACPARSARRTIVASASRGIMARTLLTIVAPCCRTQVESAVEIGRVHPCPLPVRPSAQLPNTLRRLSTAVHPRALQHAERWTILEVVVVQIAVQHAHRHRIRSTTSHVCQLRWWLPFAFCCRHLARAVHCGGVCCRCARLSASYLEARSVAQRQLHDQLWHAGVAEHQRRHEEDTPQRCSLGRPLCWSTARRMSNLEEASPGEQNAIHHDVVSQ
eukprot:7379557-Prymnesium_polylepis.2